MPLLSRGDATPLSFCRKLWDERCLGCRFQIGGKRYQCNCPWKHLVIGHNNRWLEIFWTFNEKKWNKTLQKYQESQNDWFQCRWRIKNEQMTHGQKAIKNYWPQISMISNEGNQYIQSFWTKDSKTKSCQELLTSNSMISNEGNHYIQSFWTNDGS